jgi:transglutaminase-like putative cysteine protease
VDLPADDPEIRRAAIRVTSGAVSAEDKARMLTRWVAAQVATDGGENATGAALLTLRFRRADQDGKARLLATMARAVQIPARVVNGLAVLPQGAFGHSWTEVWLGGWVAADPTFGQFPASASLIRLAVGGRSRPVDLLPLTASARFLPLEGQ